MNKIKKIVIKGFKLFEDFEMYFNSGTNILIGDNESGKSTILEAIEVVLNKKYSNYDKYIVRDILNRNIVKKFEEGKDFTILPKIEIYLFLDLDCDNNYDYYGEIKINNGFLLTKGKSYNASLAKITSTGLFLKCSK